MLGIHRGNTAKPKGVQEGDRPAQARDRTDGQPPVDLQR